MAGQQFFDVLAMSTIGTKGPANAVRIAADASGNLKTSVKGGAFSPLGGFGSDTIVQLANALGVPKNALELILSFTVNTSGAEESRWDIKLMEAGVQATVAAFGWRNGGASPILYIGDPTANNGIQNGGGSAPIQVIVGGTGYLNCGSGAVTAPLGVGLAAADKFREARAAGTISVNTLTVNNANICTVPGTPTINGLVTSGWTATNTSRIVLEVASGTTLVHNSGAPGGGAVALQNVSGANIVTASLRAIPYVYNGTFWLQEG